MLPDTLRNELANSRHHELQQTADRRHRLTRPALFARLFGRPSAVPQ